MIRVSVLTPTYNRSNYLLRLWKSLQESTFKEFEWIIVDDGSTDDTAEVCKKMMESEKDFSIRYEYQSNQGKHVAFNHLVDMARGEYIMQIDDDDAILPNAIQDGLEAWDSMSEEKRQQYWCVCAPCIDGDTKDAGKLPTNINNLSKKEQKKIAREVKYETCSLRRLDYQKEFLFPVIEGVKFIPESTIAEQLDDKYDRFYINSNFIAYYQHGGNV